MRYCSFRIEGVPGYGVFDGEIIRAVNENFKDRYTDLKSVIAAGVLPEASEAAARGESFDADVVSFDPVIPNPGKFSASA